MLTSIISSVLIDLELCNILVYFACEPICVWGLQQLRTFLKECFVTLNLQNKVTTFFKVYSLRGLLDFFLLWCSYSSWASLTLEVPQISVSLATLLPMLFRVLNLTLIVAADNWKCLGTQKAVEFSWNVQGNNYLKETVLLLLPWHCNYPWPLMNQLL